MSTARDNRTNILLHLLISFPFFIHCLVSSDAWGIGTGESAPEQVKEVPLSSRCVKRLPRDVAAAIASNLPPPPRHRPAILVFRQLLHVALGDADVGNILRPQLDHIAISGHMLQYHPCDFHIVRSHVGIASRKCFARHNPITWTLIHISYRVARSLSSIANKPTIVILLDPSCITACHQRCMTDTRMPPED